MARLAACNYADDDVDGALSKAKSLPKNGRLFIFT